MRPLLLILLAGLLHIPAALSNDEPKTNPLNFRPIPAMPNAPIPATAPLPPTRARSLQGNRFFGGANGPIQFQNGKLKRSGFNARTSPRFHKGRAILPYPKIPQFRMPSSTPKVKKKLPPTVEKEYVSPYPGINQNEVHLIKQAIYYYRDHHKEDERVKTWGPAYLSYGKYSPEVCQVAREHSQYLANKVFRERLPQSFSSIGIEKRKMELTGSVAEKKNIFASSYREIVSDSQPNIAPKKAAQQCLKSWYHSTDALPTLTKKPKYFCLSMNRSDNGRYYCVGIALYK